MEELYCNMVGWKASLAWVKAVSRYKYCIVTEGGLEGLGFVLQYTKCIVIGVWVGLLAERVTIHSVVS